MGLAEQLAKAQITGNRPFIPEGQHVLELERFSNQPSKKEACNVLALEFKCIESTRPDFIGSPCVWMQKTSKMGWEGRVASALQALAGVELTEADYKEIEGANNPLIGHKVKCVGVPVPGVTYKAGGTVVNHSFYPSEKK